MSQCSVSRYETSAEKTLAGNVCNREPPLLPSRRDLMCHLLLLLFKNTPWRFCPIPQCSIDRGVNRRGSNRRGIRAEGSHQSPTRPCWHERLPWIPPCILWIAMPRSQKHNRNHLHFLKAAGLLFTRLFDILRDLTGLLALQLAGNLLGGTVAVFLQNLHSVCYNSGWHIER